MTTYLLPCACGEKTAIETRQAGQSLTCNNCGKQLPALTMREIRALEPSGEPTTNASETSWNPFKGVCFAGGIVAILIAGFVFYTFTRDKAHIVTEKPTFDTSQTDEWIKNATGADVFDTWTDIEETGIGGRTTPQYVEAREFAWQATVMQILSGVVILLGLVGVVYALFSK